MQPSQMQSLLRERPFRPFRLHLDDGRVLEIKHPQLTLVTELTFVVGIPDPHEPNPTIAEHFVRVGWPQITKLEPLAAQAPA